MSFRNMSHQKPHQSPSSEKNHHFHQHPKMPSPLHSLSLLVPAPFLSVTQPPPPRRHPISSKKPTSLPTSFFLPKLPFTISRTPLQVLHCTSPKPTQQYHQQEQQILQFVAESNESTLPCVRTFENDLARLSLVGSVRFDQALTAAAADGGRTATEHLDSGVPAMVVETLFPGPADDHATVSTRLFLPAKKVKEKAAKLKKSFKEDVLSGNMSQNILAMTFRQVVLQQLWNFELVLFRPGTERDMEHLENLREVPVSFFLGSSDERVISVLAEAVCIAALQNTERSFLDHFLGKSTGNFFNWFRKPQRIVSRDSSVIIYKLFEDEIVDNAKSLLENFNSRNESFKGIKVRNKYSWWTPLAHSKLEKIGGPEFSAWTCEYVPTYRLEIDADKFKDAKFEGWRKSAENRWEVLLTHSQMVGLAEIFDLYYEDMYTLPNKELSCGVVANYTHLSKKKRSSSLMNILSVTFASGIFLVSISAFGQFCFPQFCKGKMFAQENRSPPSSEIEHAVNESLDTAKLQEHCIMIVKRIKDSFGWSGDIVMDTKVGAWIGEVPNYIRVAGDFASEENSTGSAPIRNIDADMKSSAQDIASYQVVLSTDGKIVGFKPTSRVGVNHWAANPLAKELYGGRKLSPGFMEPGLKIRFPKEVILIELLMSVDSDAHFALARPVQ